MCKPLGRILKSNLESSKLFVAKTFCLASFLHFLTYAYGLNLWPRKHKYLHFTPSHYIVLQKIMVKAGLNQFYSTVHLWVILWPVKLCSQSQVTTFFNLVQLLHLFLEYVALMEESKWWVNLKFQIYFSLCFSFSKILATCKSNNLLSSGDEKCSSTKINLFE